MKKLLIVLIIGLTLCASAVFAEEEPMPRAPLHSCGGRLNITPFSKWVQTDNTYVCKHGYMFGYDEEFTLYHYNDYICENCGRVKIVLVKKGPEKRVDCYGYNPK